MNKQFVGFEALVISTAILHYPASKPVPQSQQNNLRQIISKVATALQVLTKVAEGLIICYKIL